MPEFDPHTHSIASGHATSCTITDMAKKAVSLGLKMIGITDHGPAPPPIFLPAVLFQESLVLSQGTLRYRDYDRRRIEYIR